MGQANGSERLLNGRSSEDTLPVDDGSSRGGGIAILVGLPFGIDGTDYQFGYRLRLVVSLAMAEVVVPGQPGGAGDWGQGVLVLARSLRLS